MLRLIVTTPSGFPLGIVVYLTGNADYFVGNVTLASVEVRIMADCAKLTMVAAGVEELPGKARGMRVAWVRPSDLLSDSGDLVTNAELVALVEAARERARQEAMHGPLGPNWP